MKSRKIRSIITASFALAFLSPASSARSSDCTTLLTTAELYARIQDKARDDQNEVLDWTDIKDLKTLDLPPTQIKLLEGARLLRPILSSGLLQEAMRIGLLSIGIQAKQLRPTFGFLKAYALPQEQIELLVDRIIGHLKTANLPPIRAENLALIESIRKQYGLSIAYYQVLSELINSNDPETQTRLRFGILDVLTSAQEDFVNQVAAPSFWKMWRNKRAAIQLTTQETKSPNRLTQSRVSSFREEIAHLHTVYRTPPLLLNEEGNCALLSAYEAAIDRHLIIFSSDLFVLMEFFPLGVNWGSSKYKYQTGWLGKKYKGFDPVELRVLAKALKKIGRRDLDSIASLQFRFLHALRKTYLWEEKKSSFKRDVYAFVHAEFSRISALPFTPQEQDAGAPIVKIPE